MIVVTNTDGGWDCLVGVFEEGHPLLKTYSAPPYKQHRAELHECPTYREFIDVDSLVARLEGVTLTEHNYCRLAAEIVEPLNAPASYHDLIEYAGSEWEACMTNLHPLIGELAKCVNTWGY